MKKVKLIKGLSYRGHGIFIEKGAKKSVKDDEAKELVATGFFEICGSVSDKEDDLFGSDDDGDARDGQSNADGSGDDGSNDKPVAKMKGDELRAYAEQKGYDISECIKVEDIRALIIELDAKKEDENNEGNCRS